LDPDRATLKFLSDHQDAIKDAGILKDRSEQWRKRGKAIHTLKDLLFCYFSNFKIVCIPHSNRPPQSIYDQYVKLFDAIQTVSGESKKRREQAGMLFSSRELQLYLRISFEHFCTQDKKPFNFLRAAEQLNPAAATYEDHIVNAATFFRKTKPELSGNGLFNIELAPLVASSILLDATRRRRPGRCERSFI
jgi:hypothetical protein